MYKQDIQYPIYLGISHYQFIIIPISYKLKLMSLKESLKGASFSLTFKPPPLNHTAEGFHFVGEGCHSRHYAALKEPNRLNGHLHFQSAIKVV